MKHKFVDRYIFESCRVNICTTNEFLPARRNCVTLNANIDTTTTPNSDDMINGVDPFRDHRSCTKEFAFRESMSSEFATIKRNQRR